MAHATLPPSGAERWMTCPGSVAMSEGLPDESSKYSDEGTAAHFLASSALSEGRHPATYLTRDIAVGSNAAKGFDGAVWATEMCNCVVSPGLPPGFVERSHFVVDTEMVAHVNHYVQAVLKASKGGTLLVEQTINISEITGEEGATGTADAVIVQGNRLEIHDFKYGQGKVVSAVKNKQLIIYALGALVDYDMLGDFDTVKMVIHQPRVSPTPSEWEIPVAYLLERGEEVKAAAKLAHIATEFKANWMGKPEQSQYLCPSVEACQWCKAKAKCPTLTQQVLATVADDFVDISKPVVEQLAHVNDRAFDTATLGRLLAAVPLIEIWCKGLRAKTESELLTGNAVPGWKLVRGKQGNREWVNPNEAETVLKSMRLKTEEMYDMKVISPTTAEKIFGEKGTAPSVKRWNKLQTIITRAEGGLSVAPETDKREAVVIDVAAEFNDETGEDLL